MDWADVQHLLIVFCRVILVVITHRCTTVPLCWWAKPVVSSSLSRAAAAVEVWSHSEWLIDDNSIRIAPSDWVSSITAAALGCQ